ncbi:MAG TPA: short-chain fatty acid transporter [Bacillales bacterium]|nr:short-chain fatty acid transporter [Bacillales bacterium]
MFKSVTLFFDRLVRRYLPDAVLFAIVLTLIVYISGFVFTDSSPVDMAKYWGEGFWDLLAFAMQMTLIVVTGYILANTPVVKSLLSKLAHFARTPGQAIILVTVVSVIACLINYGFGLVIAALFAREVVRVVPKVDYRLLIASGYTGFLVWHGGFSGSVPLKIATPGHFLEDMMGVIPVTETLFSSYNIFIVVTLFITLPILNRLMLNATENQGSIDPELLKQMDEPTEPEEETLQKKDMTPAQRMENSVILSMLIGLLGLGYLVYYFLQNGFDLTINIVNFIFLFVAILLHKTPRRFLNNVTKGVQNAGGIIIQFPLYAGIMGMMVASGLSEQLSSWFVQISTDATLPFFTFLSAGILNIFVPSGGGQWAVQGPIMIPAAIDLNVSTAKTAMAVAWGDAWTNMIQPFWALPLLAIAGLKIRDIMGFCVMALFLSFIVISIGFLFF